MPDRRCEYKCIDCGTTYFRCTRSSRVNPYCESCRKKYAKAKKKQDEEEHDRNLFNKGKEFAIEKCAEILADVPNICGRGCPVDCSCGTESTCIEAWKTYLREKLKGGSNES